MMRLKTIALLVFVEATVQGIDAVDYDCSSGCSLNSDAMGGPINGDDGISYFNECLAYCQGVGVSSVRAAVGLGGSSYDTTSTVSLEEMQRHETEGFKLVAKRLSFADGSSIESHYDIDNKAVRTRLSAPVRPEIIRARMISYKDGLEYVASYNVAELNQGVQSKADPFDPGSERRHLLDLVENTLPFPNSAIGQIEAAVDSSQARGLCTGTLVSRNSILTAAHCVYDTDRQNFIQSGSFFPGRYLTSEGVVNPYGSWTGAEAITYEFYTQSEFPVDADSFTFDMAVIRLDPDSDGCYAGDVAGFVGYEVAGIGDSGLDRATITGYPGRTKPPGAQWTTGNCPGDAFDCDLDFYACYNCDDTEGGMSGSALLSPNNEALGVHANSFALGGPVFGGGPIISAQWRKENIDDWSQRNVNLPSCSTATPPDTGSPDSDSSVCFSGSAEVQVRGQGPTIMEALKIGDSVLTGDGSYSRVYSFGHFAPNQPVRYLQIMLDTMEKPLEISKNHLIFLYVQSKKQQLAVSAGSVRVGDLLLSHQQQPVQVLSIKEVDRQGAYAPITVAGNIIVNGVLASCYVTRQWMPAMISGHAMHLIQHGGIVWYQIYCYLIGCQDESYDSKDGFSPWVKFGFQVEDWLRSLPLAVHVPILILAIVPVLVFDYCMGSFLISPLLFLTHVAALFLGFVTWKTRCANSVCKKCNL